jgi:hypothetical protein
MMSRLSEKSGTVWECSAARVDPLTKGIIYKFTIPEMLYRQEERQEVLAFPAVEIRIHTLSATIYGDVLNEIPDVLLAPVQFDSDVFIVQRSMLYQFLGYGFRWGFEGYPKEYDPKHYLEIPDRKTLIARWEMIRAHCPSLPELDILETDGVAGDLEFVDAYLNHDILLSNGAEFVHDHTTHVFNTIEFIWRCGSTDVYQREKAQYTERVHYGRELMRAYDENIDNVRGRIDFTDDELVLLNKSLGLMADFSSSVHRKMNDDSAHKVDSFKLILDIGSVKYEGYARFLNEIGVKTPEDFIKIYKNWFQLIFAVNGRLSDYADVHERVLLQDAPDGAYVRCSENSLAIKSENGIEWFGLAVNPLKHGESTEYQVTLANGKAFNTIIATKSGELPEAFIREILIAEKKVGGVKKAVTSVREIEQFPGIFAPKKATPLVVDSHVVSP